MADNHGHSSFSTSNVTLTGNVYVDSILWGGDRTESNTITYSFWSDDSIDDDYDNIDVRNTNWAYHERVALESALDVWASVADIQFVQDDDNTDTDLRFTLVTNQEIGDGVLGRFGPPGTDGAGIGYFNEEGKGWGEAGLQQGGFGFVTAIHEIGHGLGLAHPHDNGGGSSRYPGVRSADDLGRYDLNQGIYTTMSYNDGLVSNGHDGNVYGYQGTPMAFDIAAIQSLYGTNNQYRTGNDVYRLPTQNKSGTFYSSIWDAGGTDTIAAGKTSTDATIDLRQASLRGPNGGGYLSAVSGIYGGVTIANGVTIENARGSRGDDAITGNIAANTLNGKKGDDAISGRQGDDRLIGMGGQDILSGDGGKDTLIGGGKGDRLFGGINDDVLKGGAGDDVLWGNAGQDSVWGGAGRDIFALEKGGGFATIQDFNLRKDRLGMAQGISVDALRISQNGDQTIIKLEGDRLAVLQGVQTDQIDAALFTVV